MGLKRSKKTTVFIFVYILLAVAFLWPVLQTIFLSFGKPGEIGGYFNGSTLPVIPRTISLEQYYDLLIHNSFYLKMFWLTLIISIITASLNVLISLMSAYVLAKIPFRYTYLILFIYILVMMMPFQVTLLPNYIISKWIGIYDTVFALIIPGIFNPFGIFLLVQVIKTVDSDILQAAAMETNRPLLVLFRLVVPQIRAGIATLFIIIFADMWNMVEPVLILTKDPGLRTLGTAFNDIYTYNNSIAFSGCVIYMLPVIFLYLLFEQEIKNGISSIRLSAGFIKKTLYE